MKKKRGRKSSRSLVAKVNAAAGPVAPPSHADERESQQLAIAGEAGGSQAPKLAEAAIVESQEMESFFATIFRYRHLLRNLWSEYERRNEEERQRAPRVRGPRWAATLARLWANEELQLDATYQKDIAGDLGLSTSELGKMMTAFRKCSPPCVKLVSDPMGRGNVYEITDAGKEQLTNWLLAHNAPAPLIEYMVKISPDRTKITQLIEALKATVRRRLSSR